MCAIYVCNIMIWYTVCIVSTTVLVIVSYLRGFKLASIHWYIYKTQNPVLDTGQLLYTILCIYPYVLYVECTAVISVLLYVLLLLLFLTVHTHYSMYVRTYVQYYIRTYICLVRCTAVIITCTYVLVYLLTIPLIQYSLLSKYPG